MLIGRRALVTGASGGLGGAIAKKLAAVGCHVLLTGRDVVRLESLSLELGEERQRPAIFACDLRQPDELRALAEWSNTEQGPVDILVNCAGVFPTSDLASTDLAAYERCFAVNVRAPFFLSKALAPGMADRDWGRIVNIGSSSAYAGFAGTAVYCASKHALLGLSRALHAELKGHGVRVFCVSPGSIQTPMGREVPGQDFSTFIDPVEAAEMIACAIAFDGNMVCEEIRLNRMVTR